MLLDPPSISDDVSVSQRRAEVLLHELITHCSAVMAAFCAPGEEIKTKIYCKCPLPRSQNVPLVPRAVLKIVNIERLIERILR